jgi:hypothetical protein
MVISQSTLNLPQHTAPSLSYPTAPCIPECWSQKHTDVSDVHWNVESVQHIVYTSRCEHEAWIHGAPDNAAQWVPGPFIEPVQETVNTILHHVRCGPVVKPAQNLQSQVKE